MLSWNNFIEIIKKYDNIVIFRHQNPDGDAYGSQYGLATYLKVKFPNKNIACYSADDNNLVEYFNFSNDNIESNYISIVTDTANYERISGNINTNLPIIQIDHHPLVDNYADYYIIDDSCSSCSQMIADFIMQYDYHLMDKKLANYLLCGMISDTLSFSIKSVNSDTLKIASYLLKFSDSIDILNKNMFKQSLNEYQIVSFIRSKAIFDCNIAYAIINQTDLLKFNTDVQTFKRFVNCFRFIDGIKIWAIFVENDQQLFDISIRSDNIVINDIAKQYNGGGHMFAAAAKNITKNDIYSIIELFKQKI